MNKIIPSNILNESKLLLKYNEETSKVILNNMLSKNKIMKYSDRRFFRNTMPSFITRMVLNNPIWYTAYTPYQAEISQGRLESLFNFQTMISEITNLPRANASLLDEGSALFEAIFMIYSKNKEKKKIFIVDDNIDKDIYNCINVKSYYIGIKLISYQNIGKYNFNDIAGIVYSDVDNNRTKITHRNEFYNFIKETNLPKICLSDLLYNVIHETNIDNDIMVGSTQRFGLPCFGGGPHSAFISCKDEYIRLLPGRIVGLSKDKFDDPCYRLALQTREQHIKKEKATSNICTAQALLANLSSFFTIYHGYDGLFNIASNISKKTTAINNFYGLNDSKFDLVNVNNKDYMIDANTNDIEIKDIINDDIIMTKVWDNMEGITFQKRDIMNQEIFNQYNDEITLSRYIHQLGMKDYTLLDGMIPLGSCTMKNNPSYTMDLLNNSNVANVSPYHNNEGNKLMIKELSDRLCKITDMDGYCFQPNSGAQGEYLGLLVIKEYHKSNNQEKRNIIIIPTSAHGTNFASARLAGFKIIKLNTNSKGMIPTDKLKEICDKHNDRIAGIMITYPSTFGIFDDNILELTDMIHEYGGQVYIDGANMNAMLGNTSPGKVGGDVCHLNLHKTFAIPHGGGGPGVGPIGVKKHLTKFLPEEPVVTNTPFGSASILTISTLYLMTKDWNDIKNMGENAIKNANYLYKNLKDFYDIPFTKNDCVAHEFIIDCNKFKDKNIKDVDIAKRLMDYGFHAPTLSWPVPNSLMIEPTEDENVKELDRFINAMISIRKEIDANPELLTNAPHSIELIKDWPYSYSIKDAIYPNNIDKKYYVKTNRVNDVYGDRNLITKLSL